MSNPWKDTDAAFDVMFSDEAQFTTIKTNETSTLRCCVFPREDVDPFADSDNVSTIKAATVLVRKSDWTFNAAPSIGDQVLTPNGDKYKVSSIDMEQNWYRLNGRSVG